MFVTIGYYPTWSIYGRGYSLEQIPVHLLTHLTISFVIPNADGTICSEEIEKLNIEELFNTTGVQHGISIGGWGTSKHFVSATSKEGLRFNLALNCANLFRRFAKLDYIEIDWEYPEDSRQAEDMFLFIHALRKQIPSGKGLNLCVPCDKRSDLLELKRLDSFIDLFIVMGYDLSGFWSPRSGFHSALHPCISSHLLHLIKIVPGYKIVLACPAYGRSFVNCAGCEETFSGPGLGSYGECGSIDYNEIISMIPRASINFDLESTSYHFIHNGDFISYDGPGSIEAKSVWIRENGMRGVALWNLCGDGKGEDSLLYHVR
jgi:chitinase